MNQKTYSLSSKKRDESKHSARSARQQNEVPAVVYGPDVTATKIAVNASDMLRLYREAGQSSLVELDVEGKKIKVLVHELSFHPVTNQINHVDFYAVNLKKKTYVNVPLHFVGESNAIKNLGALFMKENESIEIRCLPADIPHMIEVDITSLQEVGDQITVADLKVDTEKLEVINDEGTVICSAVAPREEVIEEPTPSDEGAENTETTETEDAKADNKEGEKEE